MLVQYFELAKTVSILENFNLIYCSTNVDLDLTNSFKYEINVFYFVGGWNYLNILLVDFGEHVVLNYIIKHRYFMLVMRMKLQVINRL